MHNSNRSMLVAAMFLTATVHGASAEQIPHQATAMSVGSICATATRSYGAVSSGAYQLRGRSRFHGTDQQFEMTYDSELRFKMSQTSDRRESNGYDGAACWIDDLSGVPHIQFRQDRDVSRLTCWVMTGVWADRRAHLTMRVLRTNSDGIVLYIEPRDGVLSAELSLDPSTCLPTSLTYQTGAGTVRWIYSDYRVFDGRKLPTHIVSRTGAQDDTIDLTDESAASEKGSTFRAPSATAPIWGASASNTVEVNTRFGLLLVHPTVNGQDVGWFILDTGADRMCIDPQIAGKLKLSTFGRDTTAGAVGVAEMALFKSDSFQLGPLVIKFPVFYGLPLAEISKVFGVTLAGVCGYDFIAQAALDIYPHEGRMQILKPGQARLPRNVNWTRMRFHSNVPLVECGFAPDHTGLFTIDTGSNSTVDFCTPTVSRYRMLEGRKTESAGTMGAGGTAESLSGSLEWFDMCGLRFDNPTVIFQKSKVGTLADPLRDGNVGMGFMMSSRIVLDYSNYRIAFVGS